VQDSVDVPEPPGIAAGVKQDKLVELVETARVTAPEKPLTPVTEIVEGPATPTFTGNDPGFAIIEKSG
jgi:hypothetical protein